MRQREREVMNEERYWRSMRRRRRQNVKRMKEGGKPEVNKEKCRR